ncbi:hypothetical protein N7G274_005461 [Stereocaulon virgatum]|uniref:MARVEL domain-containing protein n=1 Tax=Stereocaulon virgatum TaxID=373712 RepID=A0ABR4A6Z5_9LECA
MFNLNTPLRIIQAIFAIVTIGLNAYVTHWYTTHTTTHSTPPSPPLLLFTATLTLLTVPYLLLNPALSLTHHNKPPGRFFNKYAVLALDALICLLWFAAWIALAVYRHSLLICLGHTCRVMYGSVVVGILAWLAFLATTTLAALHVLRTRGGSATPTQRHGMWVGKPTSHA